MPSAIASLCFAVLARFVPLRPFLPLLSLSAGVAAVAGVAVPETPFEPSSKLPSPEYYDSVSSCKIDTKTTSTSREKEDEDFGTSLEIVDRITSIFELGRTIKSTILVVADTVTLTLELEQQVIELSQLATVSDKTLHGRNTNVGEALLFVIRLRKHLSGGPQLHGKLLLDQSLLLKDCGTIENLADWSVEQNFTAFKLTSPAAARHLDRRCRRSGSASRFQTTEARLIIISLSNVHEAAQDTFIGDICERLSVLSGTNLEQSMGGSKICILGITVSHVHVPKSVTFLKLLGCPGDQALVGGLVAVVGTLSVGEITENVKLDLVTEFLLHVLLDTPQHEGLENHVETLQLIFVELGITLRILSVCSVLAIPELSKNLSVARASPVGENLEFRNKLGDLLLPVVECRSRRNNEEGSPNIVLLGKPVETLELVFLELGIDKLGLFDLNIAKTCRVLEVHLALVVHVQALVVEVAGLLLGFCNGILSVGHGSGTKGLVTAFFEIEILKVGDLADNRASRLIDVKHLLVGLVGILGDLGIIRTSFHLVGLDLLADKLSLLTSGFAVGFFFASVFDLLLFGSFAQVSFLSFVALPEAHHVTHDTFCASLEILGAFVCSQLPSLGLFRCQNGCLLQIRGLGGIRIHSKLKGLVDIFTGHVTPNLIINLVVTLGHESFFVVGDVVDLFLVLVLAFLGLLLDNLFFGLFGFVLVLFAVDSNILLGFLDLDANAVLFFGRQLLSGIQGGLRSFCRIFLGLLLLFRFLKTRSTAAFTLTLA
ncbi:hypothetical protein HG531_009854 [Fusarium graminearum]|nr:hypothetical protein HG531_009854 [Fusarium graminearum]